MSSVRIFGDVLRATRPALFRRSCMTMGRSFAAVRFTKSHEWVRVEGSTATIGISEFAQSQLGEVVYCDLPAEGDRIEAGEALCTLESVKAVGEVYAPVDCEVVAVNENLDDTPGLVNSGAMGDGWLVKFKLDAVVDD